MSRDKNWWWCFFSCLAPYQNWIGFFWFLKNQISPNPRTITLQRNQPRNLKHTLTQRSCRMEMVDSPNIQFQVVVAGSRHKIRQTIHLWTIHLWGDHGQVDLCWCSVTSIELELINSWRYVGICGWTPSFEKQVSTWLLSSKLSANLNLVAQIQTGKTRRAQVLPDLCQLRMPFLILRTAQIISTSHESQKPTLSIRSSQKWRKGTSGLENPDLPWKKWMNFLERLEKSGRQTKMPHSWP